MIGLGLRNFQNSLSRVGSDRFFCVLSREGMGVSGSSNIAFESFKTFGVCFHYASFSGGILFNLI